MVFTCIHDIIFYPVSHFETANGIYYWVKTDRRPTTTKKRRQPLTTTGDQNPRIVFGSWLLICYQSGANRLPSVVRFFFSIIKNFWRLMSDWQCWWMVGNRSVIYWRPLTTSCRLVADIRTAIGNLLKTTISIGLCVLYGAAWGWRNKDLGMSMKSRG